MMGKQSSVEEEKTIPQPGKFSMLYEIAELKSQAIDNRQRYRPTYKLIPDAELEAVRKRELKNE
jgi:hypothetical protein